MIDNMRTSILRKTHSFFLLFLFCLAGTCATAQDVNAIDSFIIAQATRYHIPGIAVGVVKGDKLHWSKAYGWADIERRKPMSTDGLMNIASISKTITATAAMRLWEKNLIELDADINSYLPIVVRNPNFPDVAITVGQILSHTSSIKDGSNYRLGYQCGDPEKSLSEWIEGYFTPDGAFYDAIENFHNQRPDSIYQYSNVAFGLLGYLVEKVSGMPFHQYVRKNIFEPLDMNQTGAVKPYEPERFALKILQPLLPL